MSPMHAIRHPGSTREADVGAGLRHKPWETSTAAQRLLDQAGLHQLAKDTQGCAAVRIALLDGFIDTTHPLLHGAMICQVDRCGTRATDAERHATMLASVLVGERGVTIGLCRGCTLLSIPVVDQQFAAGQLDISEAARRVAAGIGEAARRGADVVQLSLAFDPEQGRACDVVTSALAAAAARGIITIVAAGNADQLASNPVLRAPGVVGVIAADASGMPSALGVLGPGIARRGLLAPGTDVPGAIPSGAIAWTAGSSVAACFVTGTFALLRSSFPTRSSAEILAALVRPHGSRTVRSVVPPRLDGDASASRLRRDPSQGEKFL